MIADYQLINIPSELPPGYKYRNSNSYYAEGAVELNTRFASEWMSTIVMNPYSTWRHYTVRVLAAMGWV